MTDEKNCNLLTRGGAAAFLGLSLSSFDAVRKKPNFPAPIIMLNAGKWMQCDLEEFIEASKGVAK